MEVKAVRELFGALGPAVTSIKGITGHAQGAAGAIEVVSVAPAYAHRTLPPTMGTRISSSFGFGGHNGTLVFLPAS